MILFYLPGLLCIAFWTSNQSTAHRRNRIKFDCPELGVQTSWCPVLHLSRIDYFQFSMSNVKFLQSLFSLYAAKWDKSLQMSLKFKISCPPSILLHFRLTVQNVTQFTFSSLQKRLWHFFLIGFPFSSAQQLGERIKWLCTCEIT